MGLLVMAYGAPKCEEDIERYYTQIRGGRKPTSAMVEHLAARYLAIGGLSPLSKITTEQVDALVTMLNQVQTDICFIPYLGLKHSEPFIEDAVQKMQAEGITEAVSIVLAPHYSTLSVKDYHNRASAVATDVTIHSIDSWYKEEKFIAYWAKAVRDVYEQIPVSEQAQSVVIFSAHSLPERIKQMDDPYEAQLQETAELIAEGACLKNYTVCWQSAARSPEPWLGPDILDCTKQLHQEKGYRNFIYAPVGFVADHLEILYDNDIECNEVTTELQSNYYRAKMPNTNEVFIEALAHAVLAKIK